MMSEVIGRKKAEESSWKVHAGTARISRCLGSIGWWYVGRLAWYVGRLA